MKFADYPITDEIKSQLEVLGLKKPTDIQFKAISHIINGEDVMGIAQTGTGKTAAFVIPTLDRIQRSKNKYVRKSGVSCLVMVPTRELAKQIAKVYQEIGKKTGVKTFGLFGGVEQEQQIRTLNNGIDVLVSTPGRMFDLISQKALDITYVKFLVLDEADLMLDMGFAKDIQDVLKFVPKKRQTLFFSATISKKIKSLAYDVVNNPNPIRIQISPKNPVANTIAHSVTFVEMDDKRFFLENIVKEHPEKKGVIFVRTKVRAERLVAALERVQLSSEALHGGIEQKERFLILDRFRNSENKLLVTTDVAARGIDIPNVDFVVNYDIPDVPENYVHRCGRTGRGNKMGQAISFCSEDEKPLLTEIEEYTGSEIERYELSRDEYYSILDDSDDGSNNWQKLIKKANEDFLDDEW